MDFRVLAIDRHRMHTDGKGVTSLVALAGCPLSCPYCINGALLKADNGIKKMGVQELMDQLSIDHCYFLYTGGGVTFGGGEPLLQSRQIAEFAKVCPSEWSINIETSLNVPYEQLEPVLSQRFSFIIDCKAMQPDIYRRYTGRDNQQMIHNLQEIVRRMSPEQYVIKVPLIPGYSDVRDIESSVERLQELGVRTENIARFTYRTLVE